MENTKRIPVRVNGISEGHYSYDFDVQRETLDLPKEFASPVTVHVELEKSHSEVVIQATVHADAGYGCDRCLKDLQLAIDTDFALLYVDDPMNDAAGDDENYRLLDPDEPFVDIGDDVKDYVLLSVPMRIICEEFGESVEECDANVQTYGQDDDDGSSTDPRWDKLKNLKL